MSSTVPACAGVLYYQHQYNKLIFNPQILDTLVNITTARSGQTCHTQCTNNMITMLYANLKQLFNFWIFTRSWVDHHALFIFLCSNNETKRSHVTKCFTSTALLHLILPNNKVLSWRKQPVVCNTNQTNGSNNKCRHTALHN